MKTCLVSMVSEQTIPNILITTSVKPDHLLFISTESMEKKGKTDAILKSLSVTGMDYIGRNDRIIVPEDSIPEFRKKVMEWVTGKDFRFVVNLTGGTKLMSLAAYEFFMLYRADMVYMPLLKNYYFPVHMPDEIKPVHVRLSVEAYLAAYGVSFKNQKEMEGLKQVARERKDLTCFIFERYKQLEDLLRTIGLVLRDQNENAVKNNGYDFMINYRVETPAEKNLLAKMGFDYKNSAITKRIDYSTWNYLRGGWLEERLFLALESILPKTSDICIGVQGEHNGNRNEYDVLAICENILYVVECKSLQAHAGNENDARPSIKNFLYKLGALKGIFGLTPQCLLATTTRQILENGEIKDDLSERSKQFNSEIIPLWKIEDIEGWLKENIFKDKQ